MTTAQHRKAILDRIADVTYHVNQAAAEGRRDDAVWSTWEQLFHEGSARAARAWWLSEIAPTFIRDQEA